MDERRTPALENPPGASDRRPLASRDTALARRAAGWLIARGIGPNAISLVGMVSGCLAGGSFAATAFWPSAARALWLVGAVLVQLRLLCNLLDGMVAVGSGRASPVGEVYNEVPDRVSDSATLIGLGYAVGGQPSLGYLAALLAMFTAYVRTVGKAAGAGSDFRGPMAKPHRMFVVTLSAVSLAVLPAAWQPQVEGMPLPALTLLLIVAGSAWTSLRRLHGIIAHLRRPER